MNGFQQKRPQDSGRDLKRPAPRQGHAAARSGYGYEPERTQNHPNNHAVVNTPEASMSLSDKLYRTPALHVAAISAAVGVAFCVILALFLLIFGLRVTKTVDINGSEVSYFGLTSKGEPTLGRLFFAEGESAFVFGGSIRYSDGSVYKGNTDGGILPHGQGSMKDPDGNIFSGNFVNGVLEGEGTVTYADGSTFKGDFFKGKPDGYGEFTGSDGSSYKGYYSEGEESGNGIKVYTDGSIYRGEFKDGMRHGQGSYRFPLYNSYP